MTSENTSNGSPVGTKLGLDGIWRNLSGFGAVGILCAMQVYLIAYELPASRRDYATELRVQREHDAQRTTHIWSALKDLEDEARLAHRRAVAGAVMEGQN